MLGVMPETRPADIGTRVLPDDIREEIARGAEEPDHFSTRPTAELQAVLRAAPSLPLAALLNTGETSLDVDGRRIVRDVFWKGSFARDTLLGWEERVRTAFLGGRAAKAGRAYAGGSFWKRFDRIDNGVATGHVVNYEVAALPGKPMVQEVEYPDDDRRYFAKGDRVLLLRYRNAPYRVVYDVIKVVDDRNAIGVMHLGTFARGLEFATFVMARHNYPFELMSGGDHRMLFDHPEARAPEVGDLGVSWTGRLVATGSASTGLVKPSPVVATVSFHERESDRLEGRCRLGLSPMDPGALLPDALIRVAPAAEWRECLRVLGRDTLLGRWPTSDVPAALRPVVDRFVEGDECRFVGIRQ